MERTFHSSQWKWIEFNIENKEQVKKLDEKHQTCGKWIENVKKNKTNLLEMYTGTPNQEILWGALVYGQDAEDKSHNSVFHFYVTREELITANLDLNKLDYASLLAMKEKMNHSESPIEGFFVIIGEILNHFLIEIDKFELKLRDLLWQIKDRNNTSILEQAAVAEHELLVWKNLVIPMVEIRMAASEAFGEEIMEGRQYKRTARRLERVRTLIRDYEEEIQAVLDLESVVSTHRGNEIMKTLTVLTTLFTPVTALGAVWGMNFKHMPELSWKYGYLFSGTLIGLSTLLLYGFLRKKGWMGDILTGRSRKSFFK